MHKHKALNGFDGDAESALSRAVPPRLSPVMRANEPTTAKQHNLNTLVRNWRAATPAVPILPQEEGTAKDTLTSPDFELDLDDFQLSISSAYNVSVYAYSVDLEARLEGLVALTHPSQLALDLMTFLHQHSPMSRGTRPLISPLASGKVRLSPL